MLISGASKQISLLTPMFLCVVFVKTDELVHLLFFL